jgi:hypothetical protein
MNLELFAGKSKGRLPKLQTVEDKIAAYELGLIDTLSSQDTRIRDRWHKIWAKLTAFHSPTQAVTAHVSQCEQENMPISVRTAWDDYRKSTLLWGNLIDTPKKAKRIITEELAMKTFQMAASAKDVDGMNRAVANLIKLNGLDKEDTEVASGAGGKNLYVMAVYTAGSEKPKIINLDALNQIPKKEYDEILDAVEADEITDLEIELLMKEEQNGNQAS